MLYKNTQSLAFIEKKLQVLDGERGTCIPEAVDLIEDDLMEKLVAGISFVTVFFLFQSVTIH